MARKHRKKLKRTEEEHNFLSIKVSHFDVSIESSINYNLRVDRPIIIRNGEELAFLNETRLEITGLCVAPKYRVNEEYEISIWGSERYVGEHDLMLRHYQAKDEHGSPKYRQYRGQSYPVYEPPLGLGSISKNRDIGIWQSVIWVKPRLAEWERVLEWEYRREPTGKWNCWCWKSSGSADHREYWRRCS